ANVVNMLRFLVERYAGKAEGKSSVEPPRVYPDVGLYHPALSERIVEDLKALPRRSHAKGRVGLLTMRAYALAGDAAHYDGVIAALEDEGLEVVPAFASGLDARPAVEKFFMKNGQSRIDALVSLTGFSLVGGPAYNDTQAAEETLAALDVPYIAAHALEFQSLDQWQASAEGLTPVESTMMVAIPELDGATGPLIYGGRNASEASKAPRQMRADPERARLLAKRVARQVALRKTPKAERKLAAVLFNFPPNAGAAGTAAYLSVFESLFNTMGALKDEGYDVALPASVEELRQTLLGGNAERYGSDANVEALISVEDHIRREPYLAEIEKTWGPAPGRQLSDGANLFVMGARFGKLFVALQPGFGTEGDPMRLLFERDFAPTHAFSAFYRYLREDFGAQAVLHFGTHGALEFMPGKQVGMSAACWPDRLIGDLPNINLYAANNPSEGLLAKRRAAATLVSHLTPPMSAAGLYRGLADLKASLQRWRGLPPAQAGERPALEELIQAEAAALDLAKAEPQWGETAEAEIAKLQTALAELEATLIPQGLHIVGKTRSLEERVELLGLMAEAAEGHRPPESAMRSLAEGQNPAAVLAEAGRAGDAEGLALYRDLATRNEHLATASEIPAILRALDGRFIRPAPGGDLLRTPEMLPTGRNLHGFDPFRIPSSFAMKEGTAQAQRLLDRHLADGNPLPRSVALVLWGTDTLKSEGTSVAQALALMGARPRCDSYGRLSGATLIPLEELGRARVDVMITLSGIFRDLLPLQTKLLAEAAYLAAAAEGEPVELNPVRAHALAYQAEKGCDLETAALRVFSNAEGAYGANVNQILDAGCWDEEDELADAYEQRKCFAYGRSGRPVKQAELLQAVLSKVDLAYQNLDSVELGVTTIDHYFDTLGGIGRAVQRARGDAQPVYIGDQTQGSGTVRSLGEQVALETRTRMLNPRWYESMLEHGHEGVRNIEAQVTNTLGWSATTGEVQPWVYRRITETFMLDPEMRARLAALNPKASARVASRLLEASERNYWQPDDATLEALREAGEELEDRLEGLVADPAPAAA
ncbi:MAG: magnesium chelatase subunit H, partial [Pseudomonadota bacterium]